MPPIMHFFKLSVPATAALASAAVITPGTQAHDVEITNPIGHINMRGSSDLIFLGNDDAGLLFTMSGPACILSSDTQVFGLSSLEWGCIRMDIKNRQSVMWMRGIKNSGRLDGLPSCEVFTWSGEDCRGDNFLIPPLQAHNAVCLTVKYGSVSWRCLK